MTSLTTADNGFGKPADPVQEGCSQGRDLSLIATFGEKVLDSAGTLAVLGVQQRLRSDVAAEQIEGRIILRGIPYLTLPGINTTANNGSEIVIVSNVREAKGALKLCGCLLVVQAKKDVVENVGDLLGVFNAFLVGIDPDGLEVGPVIDNRLNDTA